MKRSGFLLVLASLSALPGRGSAASIFSYHHKGLGYWEVRGDGRNMAMGGATVAIADMDNPLAINPAVIAAFQQTSLTATFLNEKRIAQDYAGLSGTFYEQTPRMFRAVVPLGYGVVTSVGIEPLSDERIRWVSHTSNEQLSYMDSLEANGGLWAVTLQLGRQFGAFAAGVRLQLTRGNMATEWRRTIFTDEAPLATSALLGRRLTGTTVGFGATYAPAERWTFGAGFDIPVTLDEMVTSSLGSRIPNAYYPSHQDQTTPGIPDQDTTYETTTTLPFGLYLGCSWRPKDNVLVAADAEYRRWSSVSSDFRNTWRLSLGTEIFPSTDFRSFILLQWPYRLGLRWEQHYIPTRNVMGRTTYPKGLFATAGFGIPLGNKVGRIDYAIEFGRRGTIYTNLARETVWRQTISIVGWDRWFVRRPRG